MTSTPEPDTIDRMAEAASGILRPNGYDVPAETMRRAITAALDAVVADNDKSLDFKTGRT